MSLKPSSSAYLCQDYNPIELPVIYCSSKYNQALQKQNRKVKYGKKIVANLADTQYAIIEEVCEQLQWRIEFNDTKSWDIKWSDSAVTPQFLSKMASHQKINHFPGMNTLSRKNNLTKNINRMQQQYEQQYDFYPRTFLLPHDLNKLKNYYSQIKKQRISKTFIVKPEANSQGRGIFLTQNINQIEVHQHCLVQKYITNPLLYKNLKFDLRIYALIAGCDPLRIYIYNEGLTRFATEKYEYPDEENMDNLYMHLTNYAINKDHPNYIYNDSVDNLSYGHKKSVAQFFQTLKSSGLKAHLYWADIKDIIIKTVISGQPHLQHQYRSSQPHNLQNDMCFEILGFDFMIDSNNKCHLLQINHTPSFSTDTPLDELVKSNLIRDTLILMNINSKTRQQTISLAKQEQQKRVFTGKITKFTSQQRQKKVQQLQHKRQEYQKNNLGSYEKIYPCKNQTKQKKYQQFLKYSLQSYKETTGLKSNKNNISKFRVKKINTNQTLFEDQSPKIKDKSLKIQQSSNKNQSINQNQSINLNQNNARYQKSSNKANQLEKSSSKLLYQNMTEVMNNLMTAAPILNPQKQQHYMDLISAQKAKYGYIQKQFHSHNKDGRMTPSIQRSNKKNNDSKISISQKDQKIFGMSQFMQTRDEQKTMFSKMLVKTKLM